MALQNQDKAYFELAQNYRQHLCRGHFEVKKLDPLIKELVLSPLKKTTYNAAELARLLEQPAFRAQWSQLSEYFMILKFKLWQLRLILEGYGISQDQIWIRAFTKNEEGDFVQEAVQMEIPSVTSYQEKYLEWSARNGLTQIVRWICQTVKLTKEDLLDNKNLNPLDLAIIIGRLGVFKYLTSYLELDPSKYIRIVNDQLILATRRVRPGIVQYLVGYYQLTRVNFNSQYLIEALKTGYLDMVTFFCQHFKVDQANILMINALAIAARHGHLSVLKYLIKTFDLTQKDVRARDNLTLRSAAEAGHLEIVEYLIEEIGLTLADVKSCSYEALFQAVHHDHHQVVQYLNQRFPLDSDLGQAQFLHALEKLSVEDQLNLIRGLYQCRLDNGHGEQLTPQLLKLVELADQQDSFKIARSVYYHLKRQEAMMQE